MTQTIEDRRERRELVESRRDRLQFIRDAGWSKLSGFSIAGGVLAAFGAFALFLAITASVLHALGIDSADLDDNEWRDLGTGAGVAVVAVLFVSYLVGGYVAGRMARRAGVLHGFLVFAAGVVVLAAVAGIATAQDGTQALIDRLDALGAPTEGDVWAEVGSVVGIAAFIAALVGSLLGGGAGERWHQRLATRILDPRVGPEAELEKRQQKLEKAEARLERKRAKAEQRGVLTFSRTSAGGPTQPDGDEPDGDGNGSGATSWRAEDEEQGRRAETVDLSAAETAEAEKRLEAERELAERQKEEKQSASADSDTADDGSEDGNKEDDTDTAFVRRVRDDLHPEGTSGSIGYR
jgi:hypothetical protein